MALASDPSAWRNVRNPRQITRPVGRPRKTEKLNMFYGYPAELIAEWCSVARSTFVVPLNDGALAAGDDQHSW